MGSAAPALLEIQLALRASLIGHDDGPAAAHIVADGLSAAGRLDVYRNTFASVLTNALRLSYPAVQRLVGAEFFEGATRIFITGNPPTSACLDDYGGAFPDFLADFSPAASLPYLPDVARLERTVNRALHAADGPPLAARRLAALGDAARARLCFMPHPCVSLMRSQYPVDAIWRAILDRDDAALAAVDPASGPVCLVVQRLESGIGVRRMNESAWQFTADLFAGEPLVTILEKSWDFDPAALLAEHLAAGCFVEFRLGDRLDKSLPGKPI